MKKFIVTAVFATFIANTAFSEAETGMDVSFYASTRGEMQVNVLPQWKFPFLPGDSPLTADRSIVLKLDAALSPLWAGLSGDAVLTVFPFLSFTAGAMAGTGWNYDLFGRVPLVGLGLNRRTGADDQHDGVIGNGFDGVVWDMRGPQYSLTLPRFSPATGTMLSCGFITSWIILPTPKQKATRCGITSAMTA
jgi:hypothetical protein